MRSPSRTREALARRGRGVFLNRGRNRRDNELKTLRQKRRRIWCILEFGNKLWRSAVLAITGRDHGRGAFVLRADLVQFFVQPRRTGDGQRCEKGDDNANANAGARLHASRRFSRCETLRKFFELRKRARMKINPIPILTPNLIPFGRNTIKKILVRVAHASRVSGEAVSG